MRNAAIMQANNIWPLLLKHLDNSETQEEKEEFSAWFNQSIRNQVYYRKVKGLWDSQPVAAGSFSQNLRQTFHTKFSVTRIKNFMLEQALGNLVGFIIGMWVVASFSHRVLEHRSLKNVFGIFGRKTVLVNEIPHWQQSVIAILIGYIVLELITYFFQSRKYLLIWNYLRKTMKF